MFRKFVFFVVSVMSMTIVHAQKRAFTIPDLYRVQGVYGITLSPDGKQLAYYSSQTDLQAGTSSTNIYLLDTATKKSKALTTDGKSSAPIWSKDGKSIFFTSTLSGQPQVYRYDFATGSSVQVTDYALGVGDAVISPDNRYIAFSAQVYPALGADGKANAEAIRKKNEGRVQAHIADRLLFRHWTEYEDGRYSHIIIYDTDAKTYTDVTPGKFVSPIFSPSGGEPCVFSPDSKEICYVSNHTDHPEANTNADLWTVSVQGGKAENLTADNLAWDGSPQYSPDGKYIAYRMQKVPGYESDRFRLALYDRNARTKTVLTEGFDNWVDDYQWSSDGKSIYFLGEETGYEPLFRIDLKTQTIKKVIADRAISGFDIDAKGNAYYTYSTTGKPIALYETRLGKKSKEQQLTFLNQALEDEVDIRPSETMWVKGADGDQIEVFIVKPHNFDPHRQYPLIINVHGGPQMQWMDSFRGDWQVYPGAGYVVAYPNPHGSTGYGQAFTRAISGNWGSKPYEDVMKVTDALEKLEYVDSTRIGAMGWSYGGYFMNWLQGHTKRYRCLASMMGLYDLPAMWGTTEELWFPNFDCEGQPWNSDLYRKFSPNQYVKNFATPTLIITGERDYRVSYNQSLEYFTTLQTLGIPSRLIVFSNDGHWPSNLKSMPVYYNAHLEWFHKYLGGDPAPWDTEKMVNNQEEYFNQTGK